MISGPVILGKEMSTQQFYEKIAIKILPPFIFWSLFYIFFNIYRGMDMSTLIWNLKIDYFSKGKTEGHL